MKKGIMIISLIMLLSFSGCANNKSNDSSQESEQANMVDFAKTDEEMFTDRDYEVGYDENTSVLIQLNKDSATASSNSVQIEERTITITEEGTYIISGTLNDGMIVVNADETAKLQIVLNDVNISSNTSAPIYILEADKVFVTLADGSENVVSNGGTFTAIDENNIDGAIFSKQDLTFNGSGTLTVESPAAHGIVCKDDLVFTSGTYIINTASHGLDVNDSVRITNATVEIDAGKDGIHVENTDDSTLGYVYVASGNFDIEAEGDGISAEAYMQIEGGTMKLLCGGGSQNASVPTSDSWGGFMGGDGMPPNGRGQKGMGGNGMNPMQPPTEMNTVTSDESSTSIKGLKSTGSILISDGNITIDSADDAIHSNASITIKGGLFGLASGDDGIHADETLNITAGTLDITESYEGLEALDIEISGGDIQLTATDDGLNAAGGVDASGTGGMRGGDQFGPGMGNASSSSGSIVISGGTIAIKASGDGIDANGSLTISGGYTTVVGPTSGDTATLDYDTSATITGGTFIGTGASMMAQSFSDSKQGVIAVNTGNQAAGTKILIEDIDGNEVVSYSPELSFQVLIISSPDIVSGDTYTITVGSESGEVQAG